MLNRISALIGIAITSLLWGLVVTAVSLEPGTPPAPTVLMQGPIVITSNDAIGFDYAPSDVTTYAVTSFEAQWDTNAWVTLGMPSGVVLPDTLQGFVTYSVVPTFTQGSHSLALRACNAVGCGSPSSPFAFAVLVAPAVGPTNVRKIRR